MPRSFLKRKGKKMDQTQKSGSVSVSELSGFNKKIVKEDVEEESQRPNKSKRYALVSFWELPDYMKDNEFIHKYYRANWPLKEALFSVLRWHNETLNVWTHLIGFLLFVGLTVANIMQVPQVADLLGLFPRSEHSTAETNMSHDSKDFFMASGTTKLLDLKHTAPPQAMDIAVHGMAVTRWPFYVFLAGSMFCLLSSSVCHLFCCHSRNLNIFLLRLDYIGITTMIITSFFPPIYYIFQCDRRWQFVYLGGVTAFGMVTIATLLSPSFSSGKFRAFRALLFSSMGLFGLVPAVHAAVVNWSNPKRDTILAYESAMGLFYLTGVAFYVTRIPERLKPGRFDLAGHSHQIFHFFVVLGALAHYGATLVFLEYREHIGC